MSGGYFHSPDPSGDRAARVEYIKGMMSDENCPWKFEGEQEHVSQAMAEMFADGIMEVADFLKAQAPELDPDDMIPGEKASFPLFPAFEEAKYGKTVHCRYKGYADADKTKKPYEQEMIHKTNGEAFYRALVEQGIKEKRPEIKGWSFYGSPFNTGDGIRMDIQAGAALAKVGKCAARNSFIVDNYGHRYADESIITDSSRPFRYQFYHEAVAYDLMHMAFSRDPSWLIFDETLRSSTSIAVTSYSVVPFDFCPWTPDNMYAIEQGWILKADTIEELAEKIKADEENHKMMDAATLKATCERFNELVAKGVDEDFGRGKKTMGAVKTAPFYAVKRQTDRSLIHSRGNFISV